jgi:hypothetical protein
MTDACLQRFRSYDGREMKIPNQFARVICFSALLMGWQFLTRPAFALLPFPFTANQQGIVACLENPSVSYDIYLPPIYSATGVPLPILYTMHPNGGGMVSQFKTVCGSMNIIAVGITGSSNGIASWDLVLKQFYAITRDIRQRVLFDPSAEFVGGFSGGAEASYVFSRFHAQHVAGVIPIGGWLGRGSDYYSTDRVLTNLLIARITGNGDTSAVLRNPWDSNYLATCGVVLKDWFISGGHSIDVPDATKTACLTWLMTNRIVSGSSDRILALRMSTNWQGRFTTGDKEGILRECVTNLMTRPRSWYAYQAQVLLDQLMTNYTSFRLLSVSNLAEGDFASDHFYYFANGAVTNNDRQRYYGALKALTGITGTSGDRAGDIYNLLQHSGYAAPILQTSGDATSGTLNLWLSKDAPGLAYGVESRTNFADDLWQSISATVVETNTSWSTTFEIQPETIGQFYRVRTEPIPGTSPPWPL